MNPYRRWRLAVFVVTLLVLVMAMAGMIAAVAAGFGSHVLARTPSQVSSRGLADDGAD